MSLLNSTNDDFFENLRKKITEAVVDAMDFSTELDETQTYRVIDDEMLKFEDRNLLKFGEILKLRTEVFNSLRKLDILQEYLENDDITEIMINGSNDIFVEEQGRVRRVSRKFESVEKLEDIVQQIVAGCNRTVNEAAPIQDARLMTGERVNIVLPPVAINGPIVTIRRFPEHPITMEKLTELGAISEEAARFLKRLVEAKYNIFISGGTGSGKTTFLNALSQYIPQDERIITIEDSAELKLLNADNLVRLETRSKNSEECVPVTIRDLIRTALRMRPDRIIVGEVRGAEALDMLQAMNTGHDGSLSTGHANSPKDMIARLETMVMMGMEMPLYAIRSQIAGGIDILVHLGRLRDKSRKVLKIAEVNDFEGTEITLNSLYEYKDGYLKRTGALVHTDKLDAVSEVSEAVI